MRIANPGMANAISVKWRSQKALAEFFFDKRRHTDILQITLTKFRPDLIEYVYERSTNRLLIGAEMNLDNDHYLVYIDWERCYELLNIKPNTSEALSLKGVTQINLNRINNAIYRGEWTTNEKAFLQNLDRCT